MLWRKTFQLRHATSESSERCRADRLGAVTGAFCAGKESSEFFYVAIGSLREYV